LLVGGARRASRAAKMIVTHADAAAEARWARLEAETRPTARTLEAFLRSADLSAELHKNPPDGTTVRWTRRGGGNYCSPACKGELRKRRRNHPRETSTFTCEFEFCGKSFEATRPARTCSPAHRVALHRRERRSLDAR